MSGTVGAILKRNARLFGGRIGYSDGTRQLSHAEYLARCRAIAGNFAASGVRRHDRIAVLARNCLEYLELYGGCEVLPFSGRDSSTVAVPPPISKAISVNVISSSVRAKGAGQVST